MDLPKISLEQWAAFKAVVDSGSYAQAAETLNKSQSTVSYAVSRINELLPCPVLQLSGRKAVLTPEGEVMYRHASQLLQQAQQAEAVAKSLAMNFEAEITVAMDVLLDISEAICSLEKFSSQFPHTRLRVLETSLSGTEEALLERKADIVIGATVPVGHLGVPLRSINMLAVAAPGHPLLALNREIQETELRAHRQVVLRDTGSRRVIDAGWLQSEQRWTVSHFSSSIKVVKSGLAFAFLPQNWLQEELAQGELKPIPLAGGLARKVTLYLMLAARDAAGPATRSLADMLIKDLK